MYVIFQPLDSDGEDPADGDTSTTASSKHGGQSGPKKPMGKTRAIVCESSSDGELVEIPEQQSDTVAPKGADMFTF